MQDVNNRGNCCKGNRELSSLLFWKLKADPKKKKIYKLKKKWKQEILYGSNITCNDCKCMWKMKERKININIFGKYVVKFLKKYF